MSQYCNTHASFWSINKRRGRTKKDATKQRACEGMKEKTCGLWVEPAEYRCILTNGAVGADGNATMDTDVALAAARRFQGIEIDLGRLLASRGNPVHIIRPGLLSFPIKQYVWSPPVLQIIERSAHELCDVVGNAKTLLPRPGCGKGELTWEVVAPVLAFLPDNILVIP
jgi:hypothetical protein